MEPLQSLRYAYAPALVIVGVLMMSSARHIAFDDLTELVPAFATIVMMVFTYNNRMTVDSRDGAPADRTSGAAA